MNKLRKHIFFLIVPPCILICSIILVNLYSNLPSFQKSVPFYFTGWFWLSIQTIAIILTLGFIYLQLSAQRVSNMICSFETIDSLWNSAPMLEARKRACEIFINNKLDPPIDRTDEIVIGFFEDLCLYLESGAYEFNIVWHKYSQGIEWYWSIYKIRIQKLRNDSKDDTFYNKFEKLYLRSINFSHHTQKIPVDKRDREKLLKFAKSELGYIVEMLNTCHSSTATVK